jgi:hypothetical protein
LARLHAACMVVCPFTRWSGRKWRSACNRRVVARTARAWRFGFFSPGPACMTCGTQPPRRGGRILERVGEDSTRNGRGRKWGESPLKGGRPPWRATMSSRSPHASCLPTFRAPGRGTPGIPPYCRRRNATSWKLVPFSHRSASRIFIVQPGCTPPPAVTQDGDLQFDGGGKQAGLRPLPLPQPQGFSSSVLERGVCRVGVGPCAGGGPLLPSVIGGKGVRRSWHGQLPRAWLSEPSGFGAAPGAAFRHGSWKRFRRRRASRCHPRTDLQLFGLLPVLASRVGGMGEGLMAAASALRSSLPLFSPPGQKSSSLPLPGRATASRSSVFCCSAGPPSRVGLFVPAEVEPEFRL